MNEALSRLQELVSLPPGDPRRNEFDHELSLMTEEERTRWLHMMKETDLLYDGLPQIEVPADLKAKLLQLPRSQPHRAPVGHIYPRRRMLYAACLLILLPVAGFALWTMPRSDMTPDYHYLAEPLADSVATIAVKAEESAAPLTIASGDMAAVKSALDAGLKPYDMPFPAMIPEPKIALQLQGGGVCAFGPTHAAFTRWTSGSTIYTLYQFDGKPLSITEGFAKTIVSSKGRYLISIWPGYGNPCTWALVMENSSAAEAFD